MRADDARHESLGLREDEVAFYAAATQDNAAMRELGDRKVKAIARELANAVRASATIDRNLKDSVRAAMRLRVRRLLAKYDDPPDAEARAVELVFEQAELFARSEAAS
jgi:type I restriction enzyme R subunit